MIIVRQYPSRAHPSNSIVYQAIFQKMEEVLSRPIAGAVVDFLPILAALFEAHRPGRRQRTSNLEMPRNWALLLLESNNVFIYVKHQTTPCMTSSATIAAVYRQLSLHKPGLTQCINRNQTRSLAVGEPIPSFEALGIRTPIAAAVRAAFPNVSVPTETQSKFIPAIMSGSDVLLKDEPGTGK